MVQQVGLPVAGYKPQTDEKIAVVNVNKELEERCLRQIDAMFKFNNELSDNDLGKGYHYDPRMISLAKTSIQEGFMWLNRAVFQPGRVTLPEDNE